MKLYKINDEYINFLRELEPKIQSNYSGKRIYIGVVFVINAHEYFAPLSSHKEKQNKIKKNDTIFRLRSRTDENDKLGLIHLNNMMPALRTELKEIVFSEEEEKYGNLLRKQYEYITSKKDEIEKQARRLYRRVINKDRFYVKLSCDFKLLENEYKNYNNKNN